MGLFTPKWLKDYKETGKLKDEKKLKKAAAQGKTAIVRAVAVNHIYDCEFLYDIISSLPSEGLDNGQITVADACLNQFKSQDRKFICKAATQLGSQIRTRAQWKLRESEAYSLLPECSDEIACELLDRIEDPEKIIEISEQTDRPVLANAAIDKMEANGAGPKQAGPKQVRLRSPREMQQSRYRYYNRIGFKGLSDKDLLDIADNSDDNVTRSNAVYRIKDQEMLKKIVLSKKYSDRQKECAVCHIEDPAFMARVVQNPNHSKEFLQEAVRKVDDPELLRAVIENEQYPEDVRGTAIIKTNFPEKYYIDIVWNGNNNYVRRRAIDKISSRDELIKIRDEIGDLKLKQYACGKIGHEYGPTYIENEHALRGRGHREHVMQKCMVCGIEVEVDVYEYDD